MRNVIAMNRRLLLALLVSLGMWIPAAAADELQMEGVGEAPPSSAQGIPRPARGMRMDKVVERFGEPRQRIPAVGEPPITRWVYDDYTVYFEHEFTITSVLHHQSADTTP